MISGDVRRRSRLANRLTSSQPPQVFSFSTACISAEIVGSVSRIRPIASMVSACRSGFSLKPPLLRYVPAGSAEPSGSAADCRSGQRLSWSAHICLNLGTLSQ
jgi:hypothetical protein